MKTTIVHENLTMLTRRNLVLPNAYLVREDDGLTLVDTTWSSVTGPRCLTPCPQWRPPCYPQARPYEKPQPPRKR